MAVREISITLYDCIRGKIIDYKMRYSRYFAVCCFDGCLVLGITIWNTVALAEEDCDQECGSLYKVALSNVIVGYIYYIATCCLPGPCLFVHNGAKVNEHIQAALIEDFGQPVDDNQAELQQMNQNPGRTGGLTGLKTGEYAKVATEEVRKLVDFNCVICCIDFKDDAGCCALPCGEKHVFHSECLKSWFNRAKSCPVCRTEL